MMTKKRGWMVGWWVAGLVLLGVGCASVAPDNDPVVVRAEQTTALAFETIDAFLDWEHANRTVADADVTAAADKLRVEAPKWLRAARSATKAYKANRTDENKATLVTAIAVLESAMREAQQHLANKPTAMLRQSAAGGPLRAGADAGFVVALIAAAMRLLELAQKARDEAKRTKEWTAEEEADVDGKLSQAFNSDHWKVSGGTPGV